MSTRKTAEGDPAGPLRSGQQNGGQASCPGGIGSFRVGGGPLGRLVEAEPGTPARADPAPEKLAIGGFGEWSVGGERSL